MVVLYVVLCAGSMVTWTVPTVVGTIHWLQVKLYAARNGPSVEEKTEPVEVGGPVGVGVAVVFSKRATSAGRVSASSYPTSRRCRNRA